MKNKCTTHHGWLFASRARILFKQCVLLWCVFSLVLVLLMLAEWHLLRTGSRISPQELNTSCECGSFFGFGGWSVGGFAHGFSARCRILLGGGQ